MVRKHVCAVWDLLERLMGRTHFPTSGVLQLQLGGMQKPPGDSQADVSSLKANRTSPKLRGSRRKSIASVKWKNLQKVVRNSKNFLRRALASSPLLKHVIDISADFLTKLIWSFEEKSYGKGQIICLEGCEGDEMYVLLKGSVGVYVRDDEDDEDGVDNDNNDEEREEDEEERETILSTFPLSFLKR